MVCFGPPNWQLARVKGVKESRLTIRGDDLIKAEEVSTRPSIYRVVPTALSVRVQCFKNSLYKAVEGPNIRHIVLSMTNGSYRRHRGRLTSTRRDSLLILPGMNTLTPRPSLVCRLDHYKGSGERFLQKHILETIFFPIWTGIASRTFKMYMYFEACYQCIPVSILLELFEVFRKEIKSASTESNKSNQLRNVNTRIRLESENITAQPGTIDDRKSKVNAFVINTGMNVTVNNF